MAHSERCQPGDMNGDDSKVVSSPDYGSGDGSVPVTPHADVESVASSPKTTEGSETTAPSVPAAASSSARGDDADDTGGGGGSGGHKLSGGSARKRKRCNHPGCTNAVQSAGHCRRHGAPGRKCAVRGCDKMAQGLAIYGGMCKRHHAEKQGRDVGAAVVKQPPPQVPSVVPIGESAYDDIVPSSLLYKLTDANIREKRLMPLVTHLKEGREDKKPFGWHRDEERLSRGIAPAMKRREDGKGKAQSPHFEPWERQLFLVEYSLLAGTYGSNLTDLLHAWGRESNALMTMRKELSERRGELTRKARSDIGKKKDKNAILVVRAGQRQTPSSSTLSTPPQSRHQLLQQPPQPK